MKWSSIIGHNLKINTLITLLENTTVYTISYKSATRLRGDHYGCIPRRRYVLSLETTTLRESATTLIQESAAIPFQENNTTLLGTRAASYTSDAAMRLDCQVSTRSRMAASPFTAAPTDPTKSAKKHQRRERHTLPRPPALYLLQLPIHRAWRSKNSVHAPPRLYQHNATCFGATESLSGVCAGHLAPVPRKAPP